MPLFGACGLSISENPAEFPKVGNFGLPATTFAAVPCPIFDRPMCKVFRKILCNMKCIDARQLGKINVVNPPLEQPLRFLPFLHR